ncbi:MAG: 50S ribosomal protein L9 [Puniceicoccales bacterium]|jgi:large subunit ribosomal protein L9|nr:50S ribosomal protein L9 [Puniceicoccales bacterium]
MATKKVLLLKAVPKLGKEGDCVSVRAGYARNYLIVYKFAIAIERANERQIASLLRQRAAREAQELGVARQLADCVEKTRIVMAVRTGEKGKLFGSVTAKEIIASLNEHGLNIKKESLHLPHPIKDLGQHIIDVKLHPDVCAKLVVEVVSENPVVEGTK